MADKGCDVIYDYCCNVCDEDNLNKEALFYCQKCSKGYCDKCISKHNDLFKKHKPFGRKELDKWPVAKTAMDLLQNCQQHPDHRIELFCEDHKKLCCVLCHLHDHKKCKKIVQTAEKAKTMNQSDFQRIAATLVVEQQKLDKEIDMANECLQKLQESCDNAHTDIQLFRKKINDLLDHLERNTVQSLDTLHNTLRKAIQSDIGECSKLKDDLKNIQEAIKHVFCGRPNAQTFIAHSKSTEMVSKTHILLNEISANRNVDIRFQGNPDVKQYLSGLSDLGLVQGSNQGKSEIYLSGEIIKRKEEMLCSFKLGSGQQKCHIYGICELPNGELLVVDRGNTSVKLLDMQYKVVAHKVLNTPSGICSISPNEVAVASYYGRTIQLLTVNNRKIVVGRTLQFEHSCYGIVYFKGNVFATSGTALYQYGLDGQLVKKIYEDTSSSLTVDMCAVNADGSRLYVTDYDHSKLLTLSIDGTVLSVLEDPALRGPTDVHVSETGQLLVCGSVSHNVVQVDGEGGVVTLASKEDGLKSPLSVYYSARTRRLIIGHFSDNILVIHTT